MTTPVFPVLPSGNKSDSSRFEVTQHDSAARDDTDGGYEITRPKHTRKPRLSFKVGYTEIPGADKLVLQAFYDQVRGGSRIFSWPCPEDGVTYLVRFSGDLAWQYRGIGPTRLWSCEFTLKQA